MSMLKIDDLSIEVEGNLIIDSMDFHIEEGRNYILFGPNGSGKTTLLNAIMGLPSTNLVSGKMEFLGEDITEKSVDERANLGISLGFQHSPEITGVKLSDLLKLCLEKDLDSDFSEDEKELIERFKLTEFLDRGMNVGFSGGERKRAEALQMIFLKPKLLLLDEPDSGVDVESLKLIGNEIQKYVEENNSSALIVTHHGEILEHIKSEHGCVLLGKDIRCYGKPNEILENIKAGGYENCVECQERRTEGEW
ncbi:MAG: ABC transporter ATP-binding protein [Hadesarchaea archaeon]|nr:ABC transporter ATP-binding protein [Hadesarchaea archaeon]